MTTLTLRFPSEEALRVAITSSTIAEDIASQQALGWRDAEGGVFVRPKSPIDTKAKAALDALGLVVKGVEPPSEARQARCWAELVAIRPEQLNGETEKSVLFIVEGTKAMLETAGELLRLGCDRQELRSVGGAFLLRVAGPPFYTLARAIDRVDDIRAYLPVRNPTGQPNVYVEVGYRHPLASTLRPPAGELLFLSANEPWKTMPDGPWTDVYGIVDLVVPAHRDVAARKDGDLPRLSIPMRLVRGAHGDVPTLWVLRRDAIDKMERLLASVPAEVGNTLLFAVTQSEPPTVLVRARPTVSRKTTSLELDAEVFRPHPQVASLFLPCGLALEPPLRRDKVQALFAPDPSTLTWVSGEGTDLQIERMSEDAFRPLEDWVEYVTDRGAVELTTWVQGATFDLSDFEVAAMVEAPKEEDEPRAQRGRSRARPEPAAPVVAAKASGGKTRVTAKAAPAAPTVVAEIRPNEVAEALARCEKEFFALEVAADDPERGALWCKMAELNAKLDRGKDASLCWTRALWEAEDDEARDIASAWSNAEMAHSTNVHRFLENATPTQNDVRAVAASLTRSALAGESVSSTRLDPGRVGVWLDQHDDTLDLRSLWLVRTSLSRLVGRDALGLARTRDRILQKLHRGLSVEWDLPTFLRFLGGAREPEQIERLGANVDALAARFEKSRRAVSAVEAPLKLTLAYVLFVFAYGSALLGRAEQAHAYVDRATKMLDVKDPVHGFLVQAYSARVAHALEGLPAETPLPPDVAARLNALEKFSRYKVDRVRQFSQVLEPQERLDPVVAFQRGEQDPRGPEFTELRGMSNVAALEEAVERIFVKARKSTPDDRARLFDGVMDFFPTIGVDRAVRYLEEIVSSVSDIPEPRRAELLEEAFMLAGHMGDLELGRRIFVPLRALVGSLGQESIIEKAPVMGGMLRTLRRFGLRDEASELLETIQKAATGSSTPARVARLHAASVLAYLGHFDRAKVVFEEALGVLGGDLPVPDRLELTRALTRALGRAPEQYAVAALDKLAGKLAVVTDSFNTNSHVCLSVVSFMESLVLGYASEDLTIGDAGRRWLDDDEYLIRRRIHRDMSENA